jgi:hypothetical protein
VADAKQPELPEGTPDNIRKFVECTSDKLELKPGKLDWFTDCGDPVATSPN